jgi:rare lipoprotein A
MVRSGIILIWIFILTACQSAPDYNFVQQGKASYYADFFEGRTTASGDIYYPDSLTAAHRHLPLGTEILVINQQNQKQIRVKVNDRGPYYGKRILDLSRKAADSLDFRHEGLTQVTIKASLSPSTADSITSLLESATAQGR